MLWNYQNFFSIKAKKIVHQFQKKKSKSNMPSSDVGCKLREKIRKIIYLFACFFFFAWFCLKATLNCPSLLLQWADTTVRNQWIFKVPSCGFFFNTLAAKRRCVTLIAAAGIKTNTRTAFFMMLMVQPLTATSDNLRGRKPRKLGDNLPIST